MCYRAEMAAVCEFGPRLPWCRPEFSLRYDSGHGRCTGIAYFPSGVIDVESAVATGGHWPHGVASTGILRDTRGC